nr:MAG TPA: Protein of unknown function (DUF551) [Bacteriophage sp.]
MTKYFSVDVSNDIHIINLCETLEQARETCLAGAVEAHEFADDMDEYENYEINDLPYAVYGVVLGKAECKKKTLTEEEKDERCSDFDYVLEKPEIVDYPKDDNWIKCSERLPEPFYTGEELRNSSNRHLIYYTEDGENWFVDFGWYLYGDRRESDGNLMPPYWELDNIGLSNVVIEVSHWQPLPQPPEE